jgi:hypothetical protein
MRYETSIVAPTSAAPITGTAADVMPRIAVAPPDVREPRIAVAVPLASDPTT